LQDLKKLKKSLSDDDQAFVVKCDKLWGTEHEITHRTGPGGIVNLGIGADGAAQATGQATTTAATTTAATIATQPIGAATTSNKRSRSQFEQRSKELMYVQPGFMRLVTLNILLADNCAARKYKACEKISRNLTKKR
jgi:hypothetical protein